MKTIDVIGYEREDLGTKYAKQLRAEGYVPSVVYGADENIHFYAPMILFRDLVYTTQAHFVNLNIEGLKKQCILKEIQYHPVSEIIMHADFMELQEDKPVKMTIPVKLTGVAKGVTKGGKLVKKQVNLQVKALPKNMPENIELDITKLDLDKTLKVGNLPSGNYEILHNNNTSIVTVSIPRGLKGGAAPEDEEEEEGGEAEAADTESTESA